MLVKMCFIAATMIVVANVVSVEDGSLVHAMQQKSSQWTQHCGTLHYSFHFYWISYHVLSVTLWARIINSIVSDSQIAGVDCISRFWDTKGTWNRPKSECLLYWFSAVDHRGTYNRFYTVIWPSSHIEPPTQRRETCIFIHKRLTKHT